VAQVVGGGPSGACAAETLAKAGIETFLIERKMDNCKPCGGAIPLCMIDEFDLPMEIVDRKARVRARRRARGHSRWSAWTHALD
jgi:flavin-dependent dehydrogenase